MAVDAGTCLCKWVRWLGGCCFVVNGENATRLLVFSEDSLPDANGLLFNKPAFPEVAPEKGFGLLAKPLCELCCAGTVKGLGTAPAGVEPVPAEPFEGVANGFGAVLDWFGCANGFGVTAANGDGVRFSSELPHALPTKEAIVAYCEDGHLWLLSAWVAVMAENKRIIYLETVDLRSEQANVYVRDMRGTAPGVCVWWRNNGC
jgi:hypothetical protein